MTEVRQIHVMLSRNAAPAYHFVALVIREYRRWEEEEFLDDVVRCGLSASRLQGIWALGMKGDRYSTVRNCAAIFSAF